MPTCPECGHLFAVLEDEDDHQHDCPHCGYGSHDDDETDEEPDDESLRDA